MVRIQSPILILTDLVALKPGCWMIQNSAVGRLVIVLAKVSGFCTANIARVRICSPEFGEWAVTYGSNAILARDFKPPS